jgi:hypothetical protein
MIRHKLLTFAVALPLLAGVACRDYLTGGELSTDPNRITQANARLLFAATQPSLWAFLGSDIARFSSMFTRQMAGVQRQYQVIYQYGISESTTGGFFAGLYSGGGLVDLRKVDSLARAVNDSVFRGIVQTEEALLMGEAASIFGDIVYSKALRGPGTNPPLDPQLTVYDSIQVLLDRAIVNLRASGPTNAGPGASDLLYAGNAPKWRRLAYTLKARFYMHTAKVRGAPAYTAALAASDSGITDSANDYMAIFSGAAGEQNLLYQFTVVQRSGYIAPDPFFVNFLATRSGGPDPRVNVYFMADRSDINPAFIGANANGNAPTVHVSAAENLLIAAEAAYKLNPLDPRALQRLNQARTATSLPPSVAPTPYTLAPFPPTTTGAALLQAILEEKYIVEFMNIEAYNDYKRNCYPNVPLAPGATKPKIPARLFYDQSERNTNTSIPSPSNQPVRNANDPASATDPFGAACIGQ